MGLLDEAIREHLELKRRRGADAGEITREESEALGPVRRTPDGTPEIESISPAPPLHAGDLPGDDAEPDWAEETAILPPPPAAYELPPVASPPPFFNEPAPQPTSFEPLLPPTAATPPPPPAYVEPPLDEPTELLDELPPEPPKEKSRLLGSASRLRLRRHPDADEPPSYEVRTPHKPAPAPPPLPEPRYEPPPYTPPAPHDEPDFSPAGDAPAGEDLLEETPEFLEETPDHDRLWFEQRPPRDFDFDK